jgi:Protein of unknown function (DUF3301)
MHEALVLLLILGLVCALWHWSVLGRERVLAISGEICRDLKMQRLDDSVALHALRLVRAPRFALERRYAFEFSTDGVDRRRGEVVLLGFALQLARLELPDGPLLIEIGGRGSP